MPGWELLGKEEKEAVDDIFDNRGGILYRYGFDKLRQNVFKVNDFENEIAKKVHAKHALFVSSGTAALKLGLISLGVKPGDEVITQSFTFVATVEAILEIGAKPVITEVDKSLNMDPDDPRRKITKKTKA
ncbi:MAG: aminotransferase class I/II-fold pyridoxal phosphate-dependent enzyme, partial [Candidatus Woesearchaeota archaeon]|nr:aminotransferase class I/II-fold pyridoxal phosphate-dependent enzyme [Candidatus Woesearchaeota archaeon]